jgi:hypothetical protein
MAQLDLSMGKSMGLQRDVASILAPSYMSPIAGGGVSCEVQLYTGAQINFGDLTPYLTYGSG